MAQGQRGFALITVLWTVGFLALLVGQFTASGRTELQVAANLRANAVARDAADGAVHEAILRLLQGAWQPDGTPHAGAGVGSVTLEVRVHNQAGKLNPNVAPAAAVGALLLRTGAEPAQAAALSRAIIDWRTSGTMSASGGPKLAPYRKAGLPYGPPGRPFGHVDELRLVAGMTPALMAQLRPFLSVYHEGDTIEPGEPEPADAWSFGPSGRVMVVVIHAVAAGAGGGRFTREAVVRLRADPSLDQPPYQILTWNDPS